MENPNPNDLLTNFSHEAISRVIPGLIVLPLYFHKFVLKTLNLAHDSSIFSVLCIFITAWLIGTLIEKFFHYCIIPVIENGSVFSNIAKWCGCSYRGDDIPKDESRLTYSYYLKYIAETSMFRAFAAISLVSVWVTPNIAFFTEREWHCWYGIIACVVNAYFYWWLKFKSYYQKAKSETYGCNDI